MNKIDTSYTSLAEIDAEIVRFYEEETRTRVIGHTEVEEGETSDPITEEYTVIVLNQPNEVTYEYVESRRGRRFPEETVKGYIPQAIEWEDFAINHEGYLLWLDEVALWEAEQPMIQDGTDEEGEPIMVLAPQPERPVVTLDTRRAVYEALSQSYDSVLFHHKETATEYDDEAYTATEVPLLIDNDPVGIDEHYSTLAIDTRYQAVYAPLPLGDSFIDVGRGKDGVMGIENVKDALLAYDSGMESTGSIMWIMTDNSVSTLTVADLKQVVIAFNIRKQDTFMAYGVWRETDRQTAFTL